MSLAVTAHPAASAPGAVRTNDVIWSLWQVGQRGRTAGMVVWQEGRWTWIVEFYGPARDGFGHVTIARLRRRPGPPALREDIEREVRVAGSALLLGADPADLGEYEVL